MLNVPQIKSFREISIENKKTLIICDIDDTVLKLENSLEYFKEKAAQDLSGCHPHIIEACAMSMFSLYRSKTDPIPTDSSGFTDMLRRLYATDNSELIFLTARSYNSREYTKKDLLSIGISPSYPVYFTGNMITKGEYIIENINWLSYEKVIFIDDMPMNILSVAMCCPTITSYQFLK
jgi:hypothetical protein